MSFGTKLKEVREGKGYKQNQFAEMLGITATRLNYWEKDKREPDVSMIKKIAALLDVSSDWLIGNEENKDNNDKLCFLEREIIKKFRNLDGHGKKVVNLILEAELERCTAAPPEEPKLIRLPKSLLRASAGTGNRLEDAYTEWIDVPETAAAKQANIVIEVTGDSMLPAYADGDNVFVRIQPDIDAGEIGIFIVDGDGFIKKKGDGELISLNPDYPNIKIGEFTDVRCFGRVIGKL